MKREWKPGDVAMLDNHGGIRAVRAAEDCRHEDHDYVDGDHWHYLTNLGGATWDSNGDRRARPLALIDPEDRKAVERLLNLYYVRVDGMSSPIEEQLLGDMMFALREFADPKPPMCGSRIDLDFGGEHGSHHLCERDEGHDGPHTDGDLSWTAVQP